MQFPRRRRKGSTHIGTRDEGVIADEIGSEKSAVQTKMDMRTHIASTLQNAIMSNDLPLFTARCAF